MIFLWVRKLEVMISFGCVWICVILFSSGCGRFVMMIGVNGVCSCVRLSLSAGMLLMASCEMLMLILSMGL